MSAEQLNVQEHEADLTNAANEKVDKGVSTQVDTLMKELKNAQKNKKDKDIAPELSSSIKNKITKKDVIDPETGEIILKNKKTEIANKKEKSKEDQPNYTKAYKQEQKDLTDKKEADKEVAEIETATTTVLMSKAPTLIDTIITNLKSKFSNIGKVKGQENNLSTFIEAKNAFEQDMKKFSTSPYLSEESKTNADTINNKKLPELTNLINLKEIENLPTYVNTFDKSQLDKLTKTATDIGKTDILKIIENKATESNKQYVELGHKTLNLPDTEVYAKQLFETGAEKDFNAAFDLIHGENISEVIPVNKDNKETKSMISLLQKYHTDKNGISPTIDPATLYFGHAEDTKNGKKFAPEYKDGTRIIEFSKSTEIKTSKVINGITFTKQEAAPEKTESKELDEKTPITTKGGMEFTTKGDIITVTTKEKKEHTYDAKSNTFTPNLVLETGVKFEKNKDNKYIITETTPAVPGGIIATKIEKVNGKNETIPVDSAELTEKNITIEGNNVLIKIRTIRGSQEHLQSLKADKYDAKNFDDITAWGDKTLNTFDDLGNFKTFEKCLQNKDSEFITNNMKAILTDIKTYEPKPGTSDRLEDVNELRNGYATVLTNYMISSKSGDAMKEYIKFLTPATISYLGVDKATQSKNFDNLVKSNKFKDIIAKNPKIIDDIFAVKLKIVNTDKKTVEQMFKGGFKEILNSFGGFIMQIIELFGGKGALKSFCARFNIDYDKYFKDLEKMYDDEYALSDPQKGVLKDAYEAGKDDKRKGEDNDISSYDGTKETPIPYDKKTIASYYSKTFSTEDGFKLLDPTLVEMAMKETKIGDANVIISERGSNKKMEKKINPENNLTEQGRKDIVNYIINGDTKDGKGKPEIRGSVKTAGEAITQTDSVYNTKLSKTPTDKEKADSQEAKVNKDIKGFKNAADIGVYFGAYLMKGSKDLKYTISQTKDLPFEKDHGKKETVDKDKSEAQTKFDKITTPFETESAKISDKNTYGKLDINTFTGKLQTTDDLNYSNNIIAPLKRMFTGTTEGGTTTYKNYNLYLEKISGDKLNNKKDNNMIINIKNMLKMENNKEYETTIAAIDKKNTYTFSVEKDNMIVQIKNEQGIATGTITLGVKDGKINTTREATGTVNTVA